MLISFDKYPTAHVFCLAFKMSTKKLWLTFFGILLALPLYTLGHYSTTQTIHLPSRLHIKPQNLIKSSLD